MEGNPKLVSLVLPTLRKDPNFVPMCDSLAHNAKLLKSLTGVETELVLVDGRLWYDDNKIRRQMVLDAVKGRFAIKHVEPKPVSWQGKSRLCRVDKWAKSSASNTGLLYADGAQICFTDDCTVFETDEWLLWHYRAGASGVASCGGYKYVHAGTSKVVDGRLVEGRTETPGDHRLQLRDMPGEAEPGWGYGGNLSAPLWACLKIDGFDEIMDGAGGLEDSEFSVRLTRVIPLWFFPQANVYQLQETHETVGEFLGSNGRPCQHCPHKHGEHNQYEPRECLQPGCGCPEFKSVPDPRCKGFAYHDGVLEHWMTHNHRPIHRLLAHRFIKGSDGYYRSHYDPRLENEKRRYTPLGNNYTLLHLRALVRRGEPLPMSGPKKDWRDNQLLEDM